MKEKKKRGGKSFFSSTRLGSLFMLAVDGPFNYLSPYVMNC